MKPLTTWNQMMSVYFIKKPKNTKKNKLILLASLFIINTAFSDPSTTQIGNSFFKNKTQKPEQSLPQENPNGQIGNSYFEGSPASTKSTISQVGVVIEEHQANALGFAFLNQLFTNHIFYELRAYTSYHYITQKPPAPPLVPEVIPISSERNPIGYGGSGILGYNINVTPNVSFLPFTRLQLITNTVEAYEDTYGNKKHSINYLAYLGGKLSFRVNEVFAVYSQYYAGYLRSVLSGQGVYSTKGHPAINAFTSTLEFGAPYKINKAWSITPSLLLITTAPNVNQVARNEPYNVSQLTTTNSVYSIRVGYEF